MPLKIYFTLLVETGTWHNQGTLKEGIWSVIAQQIQLVVYYQCSVLIGWATTRLYVIALEKRKALALKTKTTAAESRFASLSCFVSIFLTD